MEWNIFLKISKNITFEMSNALCLFVLGFLFLGYVVENKAMSNLQGGGNGIL